MAPSGEILIRPESSIQLLEIVSDSPASGDLISEIYVKQIDSQLIEARGLVTNERGRVPVTLSSVWQHEVGGAANM